MPYEFTHLKPLRLSVEIRGVTHCANDGRNIFISFCSWADSQDIRLVGDWQDEVYEAIKAAHPQYVRRIKPKAQPLVSLASAWSFVRFVAKRLKAGGGLVNEAEAERRAAVCRGCPKASSVGACSICKDGLAVVVRPPHRLSIPEACKACGCYLPLKAWVPLDQLGDPAQFDYWEGCWMLESGSSAESTEASGSVRQ
jgi:hypothetical protein